MKHKIKNIVSLGLFGLIVAFSLSSCYEGHYYHRYHHHTRGWYDHHHQAPPPGVNWNVDVEVR